MTPIEQLIHDAEVQIKEIEKNTYWEQSNSLYPFHSFLKGRVQKYQSLLPVEQQMMESLLEWAALTHKPITNHEGVKHWLKGYPSTDKTPLSTTELLQLFTNKNEGK